MNELFPEGTIPIRDKPERYSRLESPIWTERKATLIRLYLELFVYVTHRGTYLDAFAGPQYPDKPDAWAAHLIWKSNPGRKRRRIDRFEFFEKEPSSVSALKEMVAATSEDGRKVEVTPGDCNVEIPRVLEERPIKNPAFCLLDQRSMECDWNLVETLAAHKSGHKIELFYFLMSAWKERTIAGLTKNPDSEIERWWGRNDVDLVKKASRERLKELFAGRLRDDLGYGHVHAFPIYDNVAAAGGGTVKYWMIHASDHPEAPRFMVRAYNKLACGYDPSLKQEDFGWSDEELRAELSEAPAWDGRLDD